MKPRSPLSPAARLDPRILDLQEAQEVVAQNAVETIGALDDEIERLCAELS
jgi:hypothetical protein